MIPLNLMPFFAQYWPYFLAGLFFYTVFYLSMERTRSNIDHEHEKRRRQQAMMAAEQEAKKKNSASSSPAKQKRREAADDSDSDEEIEDQATPAFDECPFIPYEGEKYDEVASRGKF